MVMCIIPTEGMFVVLQAIVNNAFASFIWFSWSVSFLHGFVTGTKKRQSRIL